MHSVGSGLWEQEQDLRLAGVSLGTRMNVAKCNDGLREACRRIEQWDFDRISVTHGRQITADGKRVFREGMAREI